MPEINILSPHVADLIAAGEVVDRPASVVKELMENAFDAGARTVTVEIRSGGITYIRVTDDGKGIGTFGFRGEALAAISAVSRIEMTTRQKGAPTGVRMTLTAGDIQEMYETGCPEGTTMIVRDLFYNTPARLKFLKSDRAEGTACVQAALKCALGRPEISVRCIKDGKEEFSPPATGNWIPACTICWAGTRCSPCCPAGPNRGKSRYRASSSRRKRGGGTGATSISSSTDVPSSPRFCSRPWKWPTATACSPGGTPPAYYISTSLSARWM